MRNSLISDKKGEIHMFVSVFTAVISLFAIGVVTMFSYVILYTTYNAMTSSGMTSPEITTTMANFLGGLSIIDNIMVIIMVLFMLSIGYWSYVRPTPAVFFIISLIMAPFLGFISWFFNYIFYEIVSDSQILAVSLLFPKTLLICTNLHWVALAMFIIGVTSYIRRTGKDD